MPDEFPTLEAVALIGTLVALARTVELGASLREIPKLAAALAEAMRARDLGRAIHLCEDARSATWTRFGDALSAHLGAEGLPGAERGVARALSRARAGVRRGHARDLAALAVLVGATAYATRASLGVGRWFYGLLAVALALTVVGAFLRQRALAALVTTAASITVAARQAGPVVPPAATGGPP